MRSGMVFGLSLVAVVIVFLSIGIGLSYSSIIEEVDDFGSDYCSITAIADGSLVTGSKIIEVSSEPSTFLIGFSSNDIDYQEILSLHYVHTRGTDIVLTIEFSCLTASENSTIECLLNETTIGSTSLVGTDSKTGTISGILLPIDEGISGIINLKFQVKGIDEDTPVKMSLSVYPLEVSS